MSFEQTPLYIYKSGRYGDGTFGTLVSVFDGYTTLRYVTGFFTPGRFEITLDENSNRASDFILGRIVRVGSDNKKIGIIKSIRRVLGKDGSKLMTVLGNEFWSVIGDRTVYPPAGVANFTSSSSTPIETGLKDMIKTNAGSTASANRVIPFLNVVATSGRGPNMEMSERLTNLLDASVRYLTSATCGLSAELNLSTSKIDLDFYTGTDRRTTVIFGSSLDTLQSADYTNSDESFRNLAIVAGQGDGVARNIQNVAISTEPTGFDRIELFVDARDLSSTPSLLNRGVQKLQENQTTRFIEFDSLVYSGTEFNVDYFVGDIITVREFGLNQIARVVSATEEIKNGSYTLKIGLDKAKARIDDQIGKLVNNSIRQDGRQ